MNSNFITFNSSYSKDKTDISYHLNNNTKKLIKDFYKFKKRIINTQKKNINTFHTNSLKNVVNKNLRKKLLFN